MRYPPEFKDVIQKRILAGESLNSLSNETGIPRRTLGRWRDKNAEMTKRMTHEFAVPELPSKERTADEIFEARRTKFKKVKDYYESRRCIDVQVNIDGPIGIAHFGDPHLDCDGCDIELFKRHCDIVNNTEGMFAGNVGDILNNWVGRLERLYADQTTTAAEGWVLAEWMLREIPWLYILGGNHDCWSGHRDPMKWLTATLGQPYVNHGTRLRLNFPNGRHVTMNVAHDFKGHSQYNSVHGGMKKAMRWADDIYVCGHRHHTGQGLVVDPKTGTACHVIRVDSYKVYDEYPQQLGIDETFLSPCVVTIIDPYWTNPRDKVLVCLSPRRAAEILGDMRNRWKTTPAS